jgi:hypothetical protein
VFQAKVRGVVQSWGVVQADVFNNSRLSCKQNWVPKVEFPIK